ncbi:FxsA family protein [Roseibacterium sp. SDUM158017]|uniref:FxsA family protein n=1 Tax=Roseicyclus salinarum TaxID=3036773 RepID=UPI002414E2D1|nr:FxsA family protein [Roseibacterium sp. SDUM158017]MDG4646955.1 FxsA family protein [Roseibacterium sp. SDUM158017]
MWLFLMFLLVPLIEIALFIQVGGWIGLWPTLGIVIATAIAGTILVRSQGSQALAQLKRSFEELRDPTDNLAHGAMILFSGALLLTPGFFTDALGFALLVPQVRAFIVRRVKERIQVRTVVGGQAHWRGPEADPTRRSGDIIEGEYRVEEAEAPPRDGPSGWTQR